MDKKEYVNPHVLGAGLKLWEQLANFPGTGAALIVLCAAQREVRGGGDLRYDAPFEADGECKIVGRWAGDRIALVGDYAERGDLKDSDQAENIWKDIELGLWDDVSGEVAKVIEQELNGRFEGEGWRHWRWNDEIQNNPKG